MGRLIAVGDRRQAIYGFRGADTIAMDTLSKRTSAVELALSICYRCAKAIINEAKTIVPEIECADTAEQGEVKSINEADLTNVAKSGDFVLCRTNAPLTSQCFKFLRVGKKATILGRDIAKQLCSMIDLLCKKNGNITNAKDLEEYIVEHQFQAVAKAKDDVDKVAIQDIHSTLLIFCEEANTVDEVKAKIESVFSDDVGTGIILSTVHKIKGKEADTVYIMHPELMPLPKVKTDWQAAQEMNIKYVAITRAKRTLVWVQADK